VAAVFVADQAGGRAFLARQLVAQQAAGPSGVASGAVVQRPVAFVAIGHESLLGQFSIFEGFDDVAAEDPAGLFRVVPEFPVPPLLSSAGKLDTASFQDTVGVFELPVTARRTPRRPIAGCNTESRRSDWLMRSGVADKGAVSGWNAHGVV
jgi:hypothetical protein